MKIAGQRKGEAYPAVPRSSGSGAIVQFGFDNSAETIQYAQGSTLPLLRSNGPAVPLAVTLTGFTPGNLIAWIIALRTLPFFASGGNPYSFDVFPTLDLGAGAKVMDMPPSALPDYGGDLPFIWAPWVQTAVYKTTVGEVTADPVVSGIIGATGSDGVRIGTYGAQLWVFELAAGSSVQNPTNVLLP